MPTALPTRPAAVRRLSRLDFARVAVLAARVRWLDRRAHALVDRGAGFSDDRLLRLMRRWLVLHERIGALLPDTPEPEHVRQVRAILRPLSEISQRAAGPPRPPVRSAGD